MEYSVADSGAYVQQVVEKVKPFIDQTYRTDPGRETTAIGGAQRGAVAALMTARAAPDTFGAVALLSPWLDEAGDSLLESLTAEGATPDAWAGDTRFWIGTSDAASHYAPDGRPVEEAEQLSELLRSAGADVTLEIAQGMDHRETLWQEQAPMVLGWWAGQ